MKITIRNKQLYLEPENAAERCQIECLNQDLAVEGIDYHKKSIWGDILDIRIPLKTIVGPSINVVTCVTKDIGHNPRLKSRI